MDVDTVKALVKQRGIYKASLTRTQSYLSNFNENTSTNEVSCRLENLAKVFSQYDEVQTKLEVGDDNNDHAEDRECFEEMYFSVVGGLRALLEPHRTMRSEGSLNISNNSRQSANNLPPLPKISIPSFSGDFKDWISFKDTFQSLVIDNESLTQVQMLHYLNSALKGEARQLIQGIPISHDNFKVAWDLVIARYDNARLIAVRHIRELLAPPKVTKNSPNELRLLLNHMASNKAALEALKLNSSLFELMLTQITLEHVNSKTREEFEVILAIQESNSWSELVSFLEARCQALEIVSATSSLDSPVKYKAETNFRSKGLSKSLACTTTEQVCVCCKQLHSIYRCDKFKSLAIPQRLEIVKGNKLCFNCLSNAKHRASECKGSTCRSCGGKHHTLLHAAGRDDNRVKSSHDEPSYSSTHEGSDHSGIGHASYCTTKMRRDSQVLLSTASVLVLDAHRRPHKVRCLLDSGSQSNYITEALVQRLGTKKTKNIVPIQGISGITQQSTHCATVEILSQVSDFKTDIHCSILGKITNHLPAHKIDISSWNLPKDIQLADPEFCIPGKIDLLLGTEVFFRILKENRRTRNDNWPVLQDTQLGFILAGRYPTSDYKGTPPSNNFFLQDGHSLDSQLRKFWELEEVPRQKKEPQDVVCEEHFRETTSRDEQGRFIVRLPRKQGGDQLGNSYTNALHRFQHLEKRFVSQPVLQSSYSDFMKEYEDLRHMQEVCEVVDRNLHDIYYIPHHAVHKEHSSTTKLRVVFDCSSKTTSGVSLNDLLIAGPALQEDLYSIVLRFRTHPIAFTGDIEKMYRQVLVHPDDRRLQRILWRQNSNLPLRVYELQTLTYGMVPSSYLATRCLLQLAEEGAHKYPLASRALRHDFYMDDVLTGGSNLQEALHLQAELIELLATGGFPLRKFCSNHPGLLKSVPEECRETQPSISFGKEEGIRTLGIFWHPTSDNLRMSFKDTLSLQLPGKNNLVPMTKRQVISIVASIFDPLGLIGPVVISFKMFLQSLWNHQLEWDDTLPMSLLRQWYDMYAGLFHVKNIKIDRYVLTFPQVKDIQIHGFCDASESAYGCVIYIRSENCQNEVAVRLLCAKSRVAPIKKITIPRLELCGALLLARLVHKTVPSLRLNISRVHYWTDSTVVLAWINSPASRWKTFVSHRVSEIQELTEVKKWKHVPSPDNPADLISRGVSAETLRNSQLWWQGAPYLKKPSDTWPGTDKGIDDGQIPEQRKIVTLLSHSTSTDEILQRFSKLKRLVRVLSYCRRFIHNAQQGNKLTGVLSSEELKMTLHVCIRMVQHISYSQEISALKGKDKIQTKSVLLDLHPFLDDQGLLRVGGRLEGSQLPFESKHQMILPPNHHLTRLIIEDEHLRLLHGGPQLMIAALRERYWIPRIRQTIRPVLHRCLVCFKLKKDVSGQLMGQLPSSRVEPSRPFTHTGVDYAGPLTLKLGNQRSKKTQKCYVALFVCLSTKAIHLELVTSLSSEACIAALRRFIARRGKCSHMYSDNGKNFVGADKILQDLKKLLQSREFKTAIQEFASSETFTWHFIPPSAPHFGGLWEANIKSMKHHLRRICGTVALTYEELSTLLCQVEACLNSRPLTILSDNPDDLSPLTPGHFLIGSPLVSLPEDDVTNVPINQLSRWNRLQQFLQHLWRRWSTDYLHGLQQRSKWKSAQPNIEVGTVVLLKDDCTSPLQWKMGIIQHTYQGKDNLIRVVDVRSSSGTYRRPVHKLVPLPMDQ